MHGRSKMATTVDVASAKRATRVRCGGAPLVDQARAGENPPAMPLQPCRFRWVRLAAAARLQVLALLLLALTAASAETVEETLQVPIRLVREDGAILQHGLVLTIVRDAARGRAPFAILLHGRPESADKFHGIGQQKFPANSRYLAEMGFVVLVPTRIGYGATGGPDVEYTGDCGSKDYARGMVPVVRQVRQILEFAAALPYVDSARGIVVGESFGGVAAIAVAASDVPGVAGVVSVAGGDGGGLDHLEQPCRPDQLRDAFADYGRFNRIPTLWMYSRNDRFWGTQYPQAWFDAFSRSGGKGEFVWLPADKNNGHYIFNRNAPAWHPAFEGFLREIGFASELR